MGMLEKYLFGLRYGRTFTFTPSRHGGKTQMMKNVKSATERIGTIVVQEMNGKPLKGLVEIDLSDSNGEGGVEVFPWEFLEHYGYCEISLRSANGLSNISEKGEELMEDLQTALTLKVEEKQYEVETVEPTYEVTLHGADEHHDVTGSVKFPSGEEFDWYVDEYDEVVIRLPDEMMGDNDDRWAAVSAIEELLPLVEQEEA